MHGLVTALRDGLAVAADPVKAEQMQRYMKSAMPFRGVSTPVADAVFKDAWSQHPVTSRVDWHTVIGELYDRATHREERYAALFVVNRGSLRTTGWLDVDALPLLQHLIVTGAWWDLVDAAAKYVDHVLRHHRSEATPVVRSWITADASPDDLWLRRAAIIGQLRAKEATDVDLLTDAIEANLPRSLFGQGFFIRKAIGWALREYSKTDEAWVRNFVASHPALSPLSRREALKWVERR